MTGHTELVQLAEFVAHGDQFGAGEFQQLIALGAMKMVVLRVAIVVFIDRAAVEREAAEQAGVDEFIQRAIDRRPTDVVRVAGWRQLFHQLIGVEMFMPAEDVIDQRQPLLRDAHPFALKKLDKPIAGRKGNRNAFERFGFRHDNQCLRRLAETG